MKALIAKYKNIGITAALCCFFCYFYLMIDGYGGPDSTSEGVHFYRNADWAAQCGRWMIRYLNEIFGKNAILPFVVVVGYCAMIALSAGFLCEMLHISDKIMQVLVTAALVSFPVVTDQFAYLYMALSYSFSFLAVVAGYLLLRRRRILSFAGGILCFLLMLGSYQAYIGAVAALGLILFIRDLLWEKELRRSFTDLALAVIAAGAACVLNFGVMEVMMRIYGLNAADRVAAFSLASIIENLGFTFKYSYIWFFTPFREADVLFRKKIYAVFFALLLAAAAVCVVLLIKRKTGEKKNPVTAVLFGTAFLLLPLAMNVCVVLFPSNGINGVMQYHYVLLFPLFFIFCSYIGKPAQGDGDIKKMIREQFLKKPHMLFEPLGCALLFVLVCTWTLSAESTWLLNRLIYEHSIQQATLMLGQVYELDDYHYRQTPVVLGGVIDYSELRGIYPLLFRYGRIGAGPILWENDYGMTQGRYHFFREYMGFDPGWISREEYTYIVSTQQYKDMAVWPEKGSVAMIDSYAVIKNTDEPPGVD